LGTISAGVIAEEDDQSAVNGSHPHLHFLVTEGGVDEAAV
jgi:hypothetical protein